MRGEAVANGEAIVIDTRCSPAGRWYVLAMRPSNDDEPLHPYVTWEYTGNGTVAHGEYQDNLMDALADLEASSGNAVTPV